MSLGAVMAEMQRSDVLRALAEAPGYRLSDGALKGILAHVGHQLGGDQVRQMLLWLEQAALLRIEKLPSSGTEIWIATLTESGGDVAAGRAHVGVARTGPRG